MATAADVQKRKKYNRPQGVIFADLATRKEVSNKPGGAKFMAWVPEGKEGTDWIILSDHNRTELGFTVERVENRKRMIDATMRSYHTADKYSLSLAWSDLPSRSSMYVPTIDTGTETLVIPTGCMATVDGGAGGSELKWWYDSHPGPFYVLLHYDDYKSIEVLEPVIDDVSPDVVRFEAQKYYKHAKFMFFDSFSDDVVKRTQYVDSARVAETADKYLIEYDTWNISMGLVEA